MIEIPELFDRHMKLGKEAFKEKKYEVARDNFEAAYGIKNDELANIYLVQSLFQLKEYQLAYEILSEKKGLYHSNEKLQQLYFELLIQLNYFFEIEKFLTSLKEDEKKRYQKLYEVAKDYQFSVNKDEFKKLENALLEMNAYLPSRQMLILKELKFLPNAVVGNIAKKLLVDPNVSLFSKSELIQQLALSGYSQPLDVLTINEEVKAITPSQLLSINDVYKENDLLKKAREYFEKKAPSLLGDVEQTIKLHIGCLYPFHDTEIQSSDAWLSVYSHKYLGDNEQIEGSEILLDIEKKQARLDEEIASLLRTE